ncbi:hypothetical protein ECG_07962 [Echinococcus granulosus]|nr:hypothetical protein ECG_07962 [Echinococcus granulosus]
MLPVVDISSSPLLRLHDGCVRVWALGEILTASLPFFLFFPLPGFPHHQIIELKYYHTYHWTGRSVFSPAGPCGSLAKCISIKTPWWCYIHREVNMPNSGGNPCLPQCMTTSS